MPWLAWGGLEWFLATVTGVDLLHTLTAWFAPSHPKSWPERLSDWKFWAAVAGAAFLVLVLWRELKRSRK